MPEIEATASTSIYRDMKFRLGDNEQEVVMATADSVLPSFGAGAKGDQGGPG